MQHINQSSREIIRLPSIIYEIIQNSKFTLIIDNQDNDSFLKFEGDCLSENRHNKIVLEDIIHLKEILTEITSVKIGVEENDLRLCNILYERIKEIEKINHLLKIIGEKGFTENIKIIINIESGNTLYRFNEMNFENFDSPNQYLNDFYNRIIEIQTEYYMNEELIRCIYGRQFNLLNSFLRKKIYNSKALNSILKFLTNDLIDLNETLEKVNFNYDEFLNEDKYICFYENIKH